MSEFDATATESTYLRTEARSAENTSGRVSSPARSSRDPSPHHQESIAPDQRKQGAEIKAEHAITDERPGTSAFDEIVHDGDSDGGGGERSPAPPRRLTRAAGALCQATVPPTSRAMPSPPPAPAGAAVSHTSVACAARHAPRTDGPASKPRYGRSRAPRRRRAATGELGGAWWWRQGPGEVCRVDQVGRDRAREGGSREEGLGFGIGFSLFSAS